KIAYVRLYLCGGPTMNASSRYHIGESVIVKPHVHDPDLDIAIGGWQGPIPDISDEHNTVCIDWDSYTLQSMPSSVIDTCEAKGLAWDQMYLEVTEGIRNSKSSRLGSRNDVDKPLAKSCVACEMCLDQRHRFLGELHAFVIDGGDQFHDRMIALPGHCGG